MIENVSLTDYQNIANTVRQAASERTEEAAFSGSNSAVLSKLQESAQLHKTEDSYLANPKSNLAARDRAAAEKTLGKVVVQESHITEVDEQGRPTKYDFGNGNTREVSYFPNGKIKEIEIGYPGKDHHGLMEKLVSTDNGRTYVGYYIDQNGDMSSTAEFKDVTIAKDGTIKYTHKLDGSPYTFAISPNGDAHTMNTYQGVQHDTIHHADGTWTQSAKFPHSTLTIDENEFADERFTKLTINDKSGGSITLTLREDGKYDRVAIDPQGNKSVDVMEIKDPKQLVHFLISDTDLRITWRPADSEGVHFTIQTGETILEMLEDWWQSVTGNGQSETKR